MPVDDLKTTSVPAVGSAERHAGSVDKSAHDIVVVGGGAAGLELVTQLGDTLGKRGEAQVTLIEKTRTRLWKPMIHAVAAGSMNPGEHELNYLAQAHWHHFRYRVGEMIGLNRTNQLAHMAPSHDEEGREITPARSAASLRETPCSLASSAARKLAGRSGEAARVTPRRGS